MGAKSRRKGQAGEREVFGLLSDLLGAVVKRNVNARAGDCDSLELPGWACESKRCEAWLEAYWTQAVEQAVRVGRKPVLFFRGNRQPWVAMIDFADAAPWVRRGHRVQMSLEAFADLAREQMGRICLKQETTYGVDPPQGAPIIRPLIVQDGGIAVAKAGHGG